MFPDIGRMYGSPSLSSMIIYFQRLGYWQIAEILFKDEDKTRNKNEETESA